MMFSKTCTRHMAAFWCVVIATTVFTAISAECQDAAMKQQLSSIGGERENSTPAADRALELTTLDIFLKASVVAIDHGNDSLERDRAIESLGRLRHQYAIPPLLAVARDPSNGRSIRQRAVFALSWVPDETVIPMLIAIVGDPDRDVALTAAEQLSALTAQPLFPARHTWSQWWLRNSDRAELYWDEVNGPW